MNLLRRDEIWFVKKNKDGASSVFSLEEFIPMYDSDVRKVYLLGRRGGIPIVFVIIKKNLKNDVRLLKIKFISFKITVMEVYYQR